ncbi:MAG: pyridoxal 5'-phosphate synthase glutaminase subunit PdxT [Clostridiales bacterium]|jgi:5'-phosphate synthase pdxT subunit|nr:pyridoxal 5'-phosphate synthase glutaminase subunit PdxT [Clostridiales bacterium]
MTPPITIGVLSLQGSVEEHLLSLSRCEGVTPRAVKTVRALQQADGLILPGGESTAIVRLLRAFGLFEPLRERIQAGMPVWGTCAGTILLAKDLIDEPPHLGVMDITVRRNAYGRQTDSFTVSDTIPAVSPDPLPLVFIRAPWIEKAGPDVQVLHTCRGHITAAREGRLLATTFHPELTGQSAFHRYFAAVVRESVN